jgi:hypothetical protein
LSVEVRQAVDGVIREAIAIAATPPQKRKQTPLPRWTLKRLVVWVKDKFNLLGSNSPLLAALK